MSHTSLEISPGVTHLDTAPTRPRAWRRWPVRIVLLLFVLWVASEGASLAIQHTRLRSRLTARLETAFGRPVEVGSYDLSFWDGPALNAYSVTVGEDPRFGQEYFLRAESLSIQLRWQSLLRGRIEPGTLSLTRPSLNIVRNSSGDWNIAEWLPRPHLPTRALPGPSLPGSSPGFRRIEVNGGRINFKLGEEKLPFAFVQMSGTVEMDRPERWRIDLEATPWRAAAVVQEAGTIDVSGDVGGTSSRLRPAALNVSWTGASISDVLRLARGDDHGIRGALAVLISAHTRDQGSGETGSDNWAIQGRAELRQIHRWDLALRPDNPSANLTARVDWRPAASEIEFTQLALEAPNSNAQGSGRVRWNQADEHGAGKSSPVEFAISSSSIGMSDLLGWIRAFHSGISENISAQGFATARADLSGWPIRLVNAKVASDGIEVSGASSPTLVRLGSVQLAYDRGNISFLPVTLSWNGVASHTNGLFRLEVPARGTPKGITSWRVTGSTNQVRDLVAGAGALGLNISRGWDLAGPFACDLRWQGTPYIWSGETTGVTAVMDHPVGSIELGSTGEGSEGASLRAPFLNQPVDQIRARVDLKPDMRRVVLSSATAFGANWTGSLERGPAGEWQFALSGDRLAAADLDRWLNPAWRESFLDRMLPFLNSASVSATPEDLRARGRLSLDQFTLAALILTHLQGDLEINAREIELSNATGRFYGGQIGGSLDARLEAAPVYHTSVNFSAVDVSALTSGSPNLAGLFAGSATGEGSFDARGTTRGDLTSSLSCQGNARIASPELPNPDLWKPLGGSASETGLTRFPAASATFLCSQSRITFQNLVLSLVNGSVQGSGSVDFGRNLDLRLQRVSAFSDQPGPAFRLTGLLASSQARPIASAPGRVR